jgi:hypothetical protein
MGDTEDRILQDDKERIEQDRQKWIINRKRQRAHFNLLKKRMVRLNKDPNVDTAEEIWKDNIEPNIN